VSNSVVVYLRLLTSAQIRADPDDFAPFLFHPELGVQMEPQEFCENFVESVGKEAGKCYYHRCTNIAMW
jgi:ubiquitin thioesterase protein OTUB1